MCAPYVHPQRIIFILIHLPLPPFLSSGPVSLLFADPSPRSPAPLRPPPRLTDPRSERSNRFFGYQIPDSYSSSASTLRGGKGEGGGWRGLGGQEKKRRIYLLPSRWDHLSFWCRAVSDSLIARPCVWSTLLGSCGENEECRKWMRSARMISPTLLWIYLGNVRIEVNICLPEHTRKLISVIERIDRCLYMIALNVRMNRIGQEF